jgi:hypothetical protein
MLKEFATKGGPLRQQLRRYYVFMNVIPRVGNPGLLFANTFGVDLFQDGFTNLLLLIFAKLLQLFS